MTVTTSTVTLPKAGTYEVDKAHTEIGFVARHLVGTKVRGRFTDFDATLTIGDPIEGSSVEAVVQAASIDTRQSMRDDHLRTNDFLDVPNHPTLSLKSTGLARVSEAGWKLDTDLTIRGVTKPVTFDLEYHGAGPGVAEGSEVIAFTATAQIDRRDFGVSFNSTLANGSIVVGNKVTIELEVEAALQ